MRRVKLAIIIILFVFKASAQDVNPNLKLSVNYFNGFIIPEFGLLDSIDEKPVSTVEISLIKRTRGKSYWEDVYQYPEYGVSFFYTDLGERNVLGEVIGVDYFFKINLAEREQSKFYVRSGFGVNYTTKKYDPIDNPFNVSVGSNINVHFNLRFGLNQKLFPNTYLNVGGAFDHISNAATQFPNFGVNYVSLYGGITRSFNATHQRVVNEIPSHNTKWGKSAILYFGGRHLQFPTDRYYFVPCLSLDLTHQTFRLLHFGVGTDLIHDGSIEPSFEVNRIPFESDNALLAGIHFNQTIVYNKFTFSLQEGVYVFKNDKVKERTFYNRVIFNYDITKHISAKIALRAYLQDLRYVEPGIAFKW